MTDETELRAWAEAEHDRLAAARREAEISALVTQRRETEARAEIHERLCAKHGLKPESTSPRVLARAERLFEASWRSAVISRYGNTKGVHILDPENAGLICPPPVPDDPKMTAEERARATAAAHARKHEWVRDDAGIQGLHVQRAQLRAMFEKSWPPKDLAEQIGEGVTDGTEWSQGHNASRAA